MGTQTRTSQSETRNLSVPTNRETFTANGKTYELLRFAEGLNLQQAISLAAGMNREMLTRKEAREIRDNDESNSEFRRHLKPGEWAYVRYPELESRSLAACLDHYRFYWRLVVDGYYGPNDVSRVVVLNGTGSEAAAPQALSNLLRLNEGESVTLQVIQNGQKVLLENVSEAVILEIRK